MNQLLSLLAGTQNSACIDRDYIERTTPYAILLWNMTAWEREIERGGEMEREGGRERDGGMEREGEMERDRERERDGEMERGGEVDRWTRAEKGRYEEGWSGRDMERD